MNKLFFYSSGIITISGASIFLWNFISEYQYAVLVLILGIIYALISTYFIVKILDKIVDKSFEKENKNVKI